MRSDDEKKLIKGGRRDYMLSLVGKLARCLRDNVRAEIMVQTGRNPDLNLKLTSTDHYVGWDPFELIEKTTIPAHQMDRFDACWRNNRYQVLSRLMQPTEEDFESSILWLSIKTLFNEPVHDWRDLQRIKNDLAGTSCTGIEIYPPSASLVDTSNQYHLWVMRPNITLPFGYKLRDVFHTQKEIDVEFPNCKQRDFEEHHKDEGLADVGKAWRHYEKNEESP